MKELILVIGPALPEAARALCTAPGYGPGGKAPTDATSAAFATYYGNYHGTYEPPLCHAQARGVFDAVK